MNTSQILTALALVTAASLTCGCSSSSFKSCQETRSCNGTGGADGGLAGSGGMGGGAAGNGGTAGSTEGGAGTSGTAGTGGSTGTDANGTACTDGSTCQSGNCVDGVCCDTKCDGVCEACNVSGSEGTCTPYASGTDPESECLGSANAGDPCAGACDGHGACTFPDSKTTCGGSPSCSQGKQTTYGCAGDGSCSATQTSCGNYTCGATACRTSCTSDSQCTSTAFCNTSSNKCVPKVTDGGACGGNNQCTSGHCISGVCCHTSCAAPNSCATGQCLCNGKICSGGSSSCITWYLDQDDDTYGASSSYDTVACSDKPPNAVNKHSYVTSSSDCDDTDANVHPGQTGWFTKKSNGGTWDYNCDGTNTGRYPSLATSTQCTNCPGPCVGTSTWGYVCGTCPQYQTAFKAGPFGVNCGTPGTLYTCTSSIETSTTTLQACH